MNEWGIPDWRDRSAYGRVDRWDLDRWRWEFYRRRNDLRTFFDRWAADEGNLNARANEGLRPSDPGFMAFAGDGAEKTGMELFGYAGVPNPRIGDQPKGVIIPVERLLKRMRFYDPANRIPSNLGEMSIIGEVKWNRYQITLDKHEYAIKFDLDKPLREQLLEAERSLKRKQVELHGSGLQRRRSPKKWLGYLRVLDAREAKVAWSEITRTFFSEGLISRRKDPAGGYRAPPPQAARGLWLAADALRTNF